MAAGAGVPQPVARGHTVPKRARALLCISATLIPIVAVYAYVYRFGIDIPFMDQWSSELPFVVMSIDGTLSWSALFTQHNEFRPVFARLISIPFARLTGWNIIAELMLNVTIALASFCILIHRFSMTANELGKPRINWMWPILAVMWFSLCQWENWVNGFQLVLFLNVFAVVAVAALLSWAELSVGRYLLALLFGVVAVYTTTNGMLVWPIGACLIALAVKDRRRLYLFELGWITTGVLAIALFFHDYHKPPLHPSPRAVMDHPGEYVVYVLRFMGGPILGPLRNEYVYAYVPGFLGIVIMGVALLYLRTRVSITVLAPYMSLAAYALGSAVMIGLGRIGLGSEQALSSRYTTVSILFLVSLVIVMYVLVSIEHRRPALAATVIAVICLTGAMVTRTSIHWLAPSLDWRYYPIAEAKQAIIANSYDDEQLRRLYPDPQRVRGGIEALRKHRLSLFRAAP